MQTSDWAEDAYAWFHSYHEAILKTQTNATAGIPTNDNDGSSFDDVIQSNFFEDLIVTDEIYNLFRHHAVLGGGGEQQSINNLRHWESTPFDLFNQVRGWQPLLRRLPTVTDNRLLTLTRRNLMQPLDDASNQTIVSRQHWVLLEGLRWKAGLYHDKAIRQIIRDGLTKEEDENIQQEQKQETSGNDQVQQLVVKESLHEGRFVSWSGKEKARPGQIIWQVDEPFAVAPYSVDGSHACFHCGKSTTGKGKNMVRDLSLQCTLCKVFCYCSVGCKQTSSVIHCRECPNIGKLFDKCRQIDMPLFKGLLVYRAILKKQQAANNNKDEWKNLLALESHSAEHYAQNPLYARQANEMAKWMITQGLVTDSDNDDCGVSKEMLVNLFFAININAISLGQHAVGLFPGMPSMFNHSCNENVTHSWDRNGKLCFRAIQTIAKGEECCISYVSELQEPTEIRTASLKQYKFFSCRCSRCLSETEEGRIKAIKEWKDCMTMLEQEQEEQNNSSVSSSKSIVSVYAKLVHLGEEIFPPYFVTKGLVMEEYANAMMNEPDQSPSQKDIIKSMLEKAREQFVTCRGVQSDLVERIEAKLADLLDTKTTTLANEPETDDNDDDLILGHGWSTTLFEIKTMDAECDFESLADAIKEQWKTRDTIIKWAEGYRLYDLGFGIRTLILSCQVNQSAITKTELADEIESTNADDIRSVDIISAQDYV